MIIRMQGLQPRFGDLHINVRGNTPRGITFELNDKPDRGNFPENTVWINLVPIGTNANVKTMIQAMRKGALPTEDEFRQTIVSLIEKPESHVKRTPKAFPYQDLLQWESKHTGNKTGWDFLHEKKNQLLAAAKGHVFKAFTKEQSTLQAFGQTVWLIPPELNDQDDLTLQMAKLGCITSPEQTPTAPVTTKPSKRKRRSLQPV